MSSPPSSVPLCSPLTRLYTLLVLLLFVSIPAHAVSLNLTFSNGTAPAGGACSNAVGSVCRFTNVVQGVSASSSFQRDATITYVSQTGGASLGTTFDNDTVTYSDNAGTAIAGAHPEVFAPVVNAPANSPNTTSGILFRVQFYVPGSGFATSSALPGTVFITSFDTDSNSTTDANALREFVEYRSPTTAGLASPTLLTSSTPTAGNIRLTTTSATSSVNGITIDPRYKGSARYDNVSSIDLFVGAVQGSTAAGCGTACGRLGAYSFLINDSVVTAPTVDGFKTVKLTTDANSDGVPNPGDTLTYTVTYVNSGNASATGIQVTDVLPAEVQITATGAQVVRQNGVVSATASNASYTGKGNNQLLSAAVNIPAGGTLSIDIPVKIVVAGSGTISNQATATGTGVSTAGTDNLDATGAALLPSSITGATGWPGATSTLSQTQTTAVSPTTVSYVAIPPLACTNTFYALLGDLTNGFQTIAPLSPTGFVGTPITTVPTKATNVNAALGVSSDGTKLFVVTDVGTLEVYDVTTNTWVASVPVTGYDPVAERVVRLAVTSTNVGYFSTGAKLWSFQTSAPYTITGPTTLTYTDASGLTPTPTIVGSGDFFAGSGGNLYLSVNNGSAGSFLDTFKIRPDGTVTFLGRLNDPDIGTTDTYGGFAAIGNNIYGSSVGGRIIQVNLADLTVTQAAAANAARGNSDLTSCSYPTLEPAVTATKTASVVTKASGNTGGGAQTGDTLEYTIVVRNGGSIVAPGTTFSDSIPAGTTYVAGSTTLNGTPVADVSGVMPYAVSGGALIQSPGEVAGNLRADTTPSVTTDREATIKFRVIIGGGVSQVSNQATITYVDGPGPILTDGDTVAAGNQVTTTLVDIADLAISKTAPVAVGSGGTVSYTIRVWNNGPRSVTGASVTDALPAGFTMTGISCAATGTATCGTESFTASSVSITTGTLSLDTNTANAAPDGNFLTYTLTGTAPASGLLGNTAAVSSTTVSESSAANNTASVSTRVVDAVNDTGAVTFNQGATFTILANDTVGGAAATTSNATLPIIVTNGGLTGLSVNASGQLVLAASALNLPGTYTVTYRICDATLTTACDDATIAITVTPAAADLAVTKAQRAGTSGTFQTTVLSVVQGSVVQYRIVVTNNGPSAVTNATFTDAVPANLTGLSVVSATGTGTTCTASFTGSTLNGSFSGASGTSCTVTIQGTATTTGTFTNTASVTAPSGITDATTGNNTASVNTTVTPAADLAIDKSGPVAVGSGGTVSYTIRVWNNGPSSVTGATVTDSLPSGFTVTGISCAATGTATCGTESFTASSVSITTGTLSLDTNTANAAPDGNFLTYTLTGTAPASGLLSNTASVAAPAGTTDPTAANNTSAAAVTRVVDAVNDATVNLAFGTGGTVTVLGNDTVGGAAATTANVAVTVQNAGGITGLTVNASGQLVVPAGTPAGSYTVTYQICDATLTTACDAATVTVNVGAASADLTITKTGPAFAKPGETITYTLTVTNAGPNPATGVTVSDTLPTGLTYVSSAPAATVSGQTLSWTLGTLAASASQSITVTATAPVEATLLSTPATRTLTNTASVSSATTDPTPANNTAAAVTQMVAAKLTKSVRNVTQNTTFGTSGGGLPGEVLEYCIAFENIGGAPLPNFVVTDHVPGTTNAQTGGYDAEEASAATGFGVKLTRSTANPTTSYFTSAADADDGALSSTGGSFGRGTMTVNLGALTVGDQGSVCFRTAIR